MHISQGQIGAIKTGYIDNGTVSRLMGWPPGITTDIILETLEERKKRMSLLQQLDEFYGISEGVHMADQIHASVPEKDRAIIRVCGVVLYAVLFLVWIGVIILSAGLVG